MKISNITNAIYIIAVLAISNTHCSAEEPNAKQFSQHDMRVALRLQDLSELVEALHRMEKQIKDPKTPEHVKSKLSKSTLGNLIYTDNIVKELESLVGADKLATHIEEEAKRLQTEGEETYNQFVVPEGKLKPDSPKIQRMLRLVNTLRKNKQDNKLK